MKIASWNVNSINARLPNVLAWLKESQVDVLLMQELKSIDDNFPAEGFEELGYNCTVFGQKSWNGVAIISKYPVSDVVRGLPLNDGDEDIQSRYLEATINDIRIACLYLPNGNPVDTDKYPYKLKWMDRLYQQTQEHLSNSDLPLVLGGDFNIIPEARDCYDANAWKDDALFKLESRQKFRSLLHLGMTDAFRAVNDDSEQFTFWDYQAGRWHKGEGIRIDHFLLSAPAADLLKGCVVDKNPRGEKKASDHTPIILELQK